MHVAFGSSQAQYELVQVQLPLHAGFGCCASGYRATHSLILADTLRLNILSSMSNHFSSSLVWWTYLEGCLQH
jgi:hypothetical protein